MAHTPKQFNEAMAAIFGVLPRAYRIITDEIVDLRAQRQALLDALQRLGSMEAFDVARSMSLINDTELLDRIEFAQEKLKGFGAGVEIVTSPPFLCARCGHDIDSRGKRLHHSPCGNYCETCGPCHCHDPCRSR